jgi:hypothetical protein
VNHTHRAGPTGVTRRTLERFALIAFGLYHVPLFLNNYPSLGGGGFSDDGLAARWGHVFTPVGAWVARYLFHMTGPMPFAYQGDNGDVGEEFGRLLLSVAIASLGAAVWTWADRKRPGGRWVEGALRLLLRYAIALGLASYAVAKLFPQQFPPLDAISLENRIGDLTPMRLLWNFMQYSRPYSVFGGVMEMSVVLLLCFRRTATLGALLCVTVMSNVALLNMAYGVQVKLYSLMMVASAAVLVLYDAPRLRALLVSNQPVAPAPLEFSPVDRLPAPLRWSIKAALVGSVILSSVVAMKPPGGAPMTPPSALDGGWVVRSFARNGQVLDSTGNPARWRRFIVTAYGVAIRFESDSLLRCRRTAPTDSGKLAFACAKGRQGELRWTRDGDDLRLDGTFDGARVAASAHHLDRSDYALFRSGFRWIYDR